MKPICVILFFLIFTHQHILAQSEEEIFSMSLEELMSVKIESVSKKAENLFDAPLSSYIISRADMINAGVNSIPEALKLCPGIIVREMTNGIYDFHIRGFDNPTQYSLTSSSVNLLTLVMINNRPVFNHNNGGTLWETLPVDINDIERIEVVRGPASALYGPNAVTGVINIITSQQEHEGTTITANAQYGSFNSYIANTSVGLKKDKLSIMASGNFQQRGRTVNEYYEFFGDRMVENPADLNEMLPYGTSFYLPVSQDSILFVPMEQMSRPISNPEQMFPNQDQALLKYGINLQANYQFSEDIHFNLSTGYNNSQSQRAFFNNITTLLSTVSSDSRYIDFGAKILNGNFRSSYLKGFENIYHGRPGMEYYYQVWDMNLDYDFFLGKHLMVRPSFSFQEATYNDIENTVEKGVPGILNGEATFQNIAGAIRLDYRPIENLRLIAGLRTDHFNNPDDLYLSYQFSASYKVNDNFMLRSTYSRANSGSYMGNTYSNYSYENNLMSMGLPVNLNIAYRGNPDLQIFMSRMFEIGWRANLTDFLQVDMDLFTQGGNNMMGMIKQPQQISIDPQTMMPTILLGRQIENVDTHIRMNGMTFSASLALKKMLIRPFITYQHSQLSNFNRYQVDPLADPVNNLDQKEDKKHKATPDYYGGIFFNYVPVKKLNINFSPYFFAAHQQYHEQDNVAGRDSDIGKIQAKFQLNGRVGYELIEGMDLFISAKNLLDQQYREFYGADQIGSLYFAGFNLNL
ncbi:MAG: TonB-dependent receptor plug domain-containing protein [Candidatus Cyclobacteriaceae bacterium M3_2C_046]